MPKRLFEHYIMGSCIRGNFLHTFGKSPLNMYLVRRPSDVGFGCQKCQDSVSHTWTKFRIRKYIIKTPFMVGYLSLLLTIYRMAQAVDKYMKRHAPLMRIHSFSLISR